MMVPTSALSLWPVCRAAARLSAEHPILPRRARMLDALHAGLGSERDPFLKEHYNRAMFSMPDADRTLVADALGAIMVSSKPPYMRPAPVPGDADRQVPTGTVGIRGLIDYAWHDAGTGHHVGVVYFRGDKPADHRSELLALAVLHGAPLGVDKVTAHELTPQDGGDTETEVTGIQGPDGHAARLEAFARKLAETEQPATVGTHCMKCDHRRWCPAWTFPVARDVHHTLVPLLVRPKSGEGRSGTIADADVIKSLRVATSLRDLAHRIEVNARAEFDGRGGRPFLEGTRWAWWPKKWEPKPAERWTLQEQSAPPPADVRRP